MSVYMRFPGGRKKAFTMSYDDGVETDIRLIEIMRKNGLKGTFNINSGLFAPEGTVYPPEKFARRMSRSAAYDTYVNSGMEIACHGLTHAYLDQLPPELATYEVLRDRENLEEMFDRQIRGMAYAYGRFNDNAVETLKKCGIAYSRTVISTNSFDIPGDWHRLPATCHHNSDKLTALAKKFLEKSPTGDPWLFYLWGHSYEFERDNNWALIEEFASYIGGQSDIWYCTNIELYDYIAAYRALKFSVNGKIVFNPTAMPVCFEMNMNKKIYTISPGETVRISD
ncbi:MAG: polysaccharide deacetylase family protein [Clostridiales bacterium]|nr:polysaccharide deacetylase family protein [Clostridiales bacterium]